mmetsp:Transcript_15144/g.43068  ORF Transcript_15144/g.43068 Transcript_15144/m.43068 type:complete len:334 (+) Transcript_15144:20-1021(+)
MHFTRHVSDVMMVKMMVRRSDPSRHSTRRSVQSTQLRVEQLLDLVVQHEHKRASGSTQNVRQRTLEERTGSLLRRNLPPAVHRSIVLLLTTRLHHQPTPDRIERIRQHTRGTGHSLGHGPLGHKRRILLVLEQHTLGGIVQSKVRSPVHDDTLDGHAESLVECPGSTLLGSLAEAVDQSRKLPVLSGSDIGSQTRTGKVERVDNQQRTGTRKTSRRQVGHEERPEVGRRVVLREQPLDRVLERKVEGLRREVTHDVRHVPAPEGRHTLLTGHAHKAVADTRVTRDLPRLNTRVGVLGLEQQLDALNRRHRRLGDCSSGPYRRLVGDPRGQRGV